MAQIVITIPDNLVTDVLDAICSRYQYQDMVQGEGNPPEEPFINNPETKVQFSKRMILKHIKQIYLSEETIKAENIAREDAQALAKTVTDQLS